MTLTKEDLQAISQIVDERLDAKLKAGLEESEARLYAKLDEKLDAKLDEKLDAKLCVRLKPIEDELKAVRGELEDVKGETKTMRGELEDLKGEVHYIKLFQENVIMPRLNTIESCYTSTFERYKEHVDRMEETYEDVALLKKVVASHSEKLQRAGIA